MNDVAVESVVPIHQTAGVDVQPSSFSGGSDAFLPEEQMPFYLPRKNTLVLELGSFHLRIGFAEKEDQAPTTITNAIAYYRYKRDGPGASDVDVMTEKNAPENNSIFGGDEASGVGLNASTTMSEALVVDLEERYASVRNNLKRASQSSSVRFLTHENSRETLSPESDTPTEWVSIEGEPSYLVGDQVLYLDDSDPYDIYFPFYAGRFNYQYSHLTCSDSDHQSFAITHAFVIDSITKILTEVVQVYMGIGKGELALHDVMLVIPDAFCKREVKDLIGILLLEIGFGNVLIHKSSLCAALGAGKTTCCVVNLGYSHTSIACVSKFDVLKSSVVSTPYGGIDVSLFLKDLLVRSSDVNFFQYHSANIQKSVQDLIIFEEIKESTCHLDVSLVKPEMYVFLVRQRHAPTVLYRMDIGMAQLIAPFILLSPALRPKRVTTTQTRHAMSVAHAHSQYDPEDLWAIILMSNDSSCCCFNQEFSQWEKKTFSSPILPNSSSLPIDSSATTSSASNSDAITSPNGALDAGTTELFTSPSSDAPSVTMPSLAQKVIESITTASTQPRVQQTLFGHILLTGGSSSFAGLKNCLEADIHQLLPEEPSIQISVTPPTTGTSPANCVWRGAAVLASKASRDCWLDRRSFRLKGLTALREKSLFPWDT